MQIEGSIALITGSGRRIGRAIAIELARRGAVVAVHYNTSLEGAEETLRQIQNLGAVASLFQANLLDNDDREGLIKAVEARLGPIQILVNNAAVFSLGSLNDTTSEMWDDQMNVNAKAPFFLSQICGCEMMKRGSGKIVNIADPAGEMIWTRYFSYSVSKAALLAVTRGLARSLAPVAQVNAVAPGPVHFPDKYTEEQRKKAIEQTLLKRAGKTDDVVRAVVFLIENDYITGEVLHVDGGRHLL